MYFLLVSTKRLCASSADNFANVVASSCETSSEGSDGVGGTLGEMELTDMVILSFVLDFLPRKVIA